MAIETSSASIPGTERRRETTAAGLVFALVRVVVVVPHVGAWVRSDVTRVASTKSG